MAGPSLEHELARAADNLGMVRYQEGDLERAAAAHQRAIDIFAKDPALASRTSQALTNLAWIRWSEGQRASAEHAAHRAIELAHTSTREVDPRAVAARAILSRVLYEQGDVRGARAALGEANDFASALAPAYRPLLSGSLMHLAQVLLYLGRPEEARAWAAEAVEGGDTAYGPHHPLVHAARCVLGQAHQMLGADDAAMAELTEVVTEAKSFVSQMDQVVAVALAYLAQTHLDLGQVDEARAQLADFEYFRPRVCGTRRHFEAQVHLVRGRLALATDQPHAAFSACTLSDRMLEEDLGPRHPARVSSWCLLGDVHLQRRRPGRRDDVIRRGAGARRHQRHRGSSDAGVRSPGQGCGTRSLRCDARRADGDGAREAPPRCRAGLAERAAGADLRATAGRAEPSRQPAMNPRRPPC